MESYNAAIGIPPDVPWPNPTRGSSPEILEYEPKVSVPPVTGVFVVAGAVDADAPFAVLDVLVSAPLSSPHAVAIKPTAAATTNARLNLMMAIPLALTVPTCDHYLMDSRKAT